MTSADAGHDAGQDAGTDSTAPTVPAPRRRVGLLVATALFAYLADLISKVLVVAHLGDQHAPVRLLGGAIYLVQTRNPGAAFSVGTGATVVLTGIAVVVVVVIVRTARNMRSAGWAVALGLVLGGALGNLTDRLFRSPGVFRGHVVDWISLFSNDGHVWPIFNLADSAIVCGAILAAILALRGIEIDGSTGSRG